MTHSTVAEVLFMGMEGETSGLEVLTTVQSMENLDEYAALQRACEILEYLTAHAMIDVWLGDPVTRDPLPRLGDPKGVQLITPERVKDIVTSDDDRMLVYDTTARGEPLVELRWGSRELNARTIYTRTPDLTEVGDQPFSPMPEIAQALQQAIDNL